LETICKIGCTLCDMGFQSQIILQNYNANNVILQFNDLQVIVSAKELEKAVENCICTEEGNFY